jgi:glycosyltransferase involved in cell wall biosynthesis
MKSNKKKLKIVLISSMQPYSNYSRNLAMGLAKEDIDLIVYAEKLGKNKEITGCGEIKLLWRKGFSFFIDVYKELLKDKPNVVHVQQEFNMFGGTSLSVIFPFFLLILRFFKAKKVVTIHAVVEKGLINKEFVKFFKGDESRLPPVLLRVFFRYFYWLTVLFSDEVIVHTDLLKKHLVDGYDVSPRKINVIPVAAWIRFDKKKKQRGDYFFYFGYLVRRKGLKNVVDGFIKFVEKTKNTDFKLLLGGGVIKGQEFARDEILELIEKHSLQDQIRYLGFLEKDDIENYLANSYACVVPGVFTIAASGPLSHVFGYGKCVLASDVGYLAEEIEEGREGFLVENNEWSKVFEKAALNPELVERIEKNVEIKAKKRSNEEVAKMHLRVYKG